MVFLPSFSDRNQLHHRKKFGFSRYKKNEMRKKMRIFKIFFLIISRYENIFNWQGYMNLRGALYAKQRFFDTFKKSFDKTIKKSIILGKYVFSEFRFTYSFSLRFRSLLL